MKKNSTSMTLASARTLGSRALDSMIWLFGRGSRNFWDAHYRFGGTSGPGSGGLLANYIAETINSFIKQHSVSTVVDFGWGDGGQLSLLQCPEYIGLDVSQRALIRCIRRFKNDELKSFFHYDPSAFVDNHGVVRRDLAISLDVIFHLVEDNIYEAYMEQLFNSAERFVTIYSSNGRNSVGEPTLYSASILYRLGYPAPRTVATLGKPREPILEYDPGFLLYV